MRSSIKRHLGGALAVMLSAGAAVLLPTQASATVTVGVDTGTLSYVSKRQHRGFRTHSYGHRHYGYAKPRSYAGHGKYGYGSRGHYGKRYIREPFVGKPRYRNYSHGSRSIRHYPIQRFPNTFRGYSR